MANASLRYKPGVNAEETPALNQGGYSLGQFIRFKNGQVQKLGGWLKYYANSIGSVPKALHAWNDLNNTGHLAVGAVNSLSVITAGLQQTITPQTLTTNLAAAFSTTSGTKVVTIVDAAITNPTILDSVLFQTPVFVGGLVLSGLYPISGIVGANSYTINAAKNATATVTASGAVPTFTTAVNSSVVNVNLPLHGLRLGDAMTFPVPTTVGGVVIAGAYNASSIVDVNNVQITAATLATSTATVIMNSGVARITYLISLGPAPTGVGYGLGGYGTGGYGLGVVPPEQTGTPIAAIDWTLDNWGELLIGCAENAGLYYWGPNRGLQTANLISSGPAFNSGCFIAMPAQILVTWGSTLPPSQDQIGAIQDPMLVQWSDQLDFTVWSPTTTNQAGNFRIPRGSKIISGIQGPNQAFIWTDIGVWSMMYQGINNFVFGFNEIGQGCGLIGKHARCVLRGSVFYMSQNNFYVIGQNSPQVLQCTVWDLVFQNLDTANQQKCTASANSLFSEIEFNYPSLSGGTGENDKYVKFNVVEGTWDAGDLARSAQIDQSVLGAPIKAHPNGMIYQHEISPDADGAPMNSYVETGLTRIAEGNQITFVDLIYPDMKWGLANGAQNASVSITITAYNTPNSQGVAKGPYTMTSAVEFINTRLRGRYIKIRYESNDSGSFWRVGSPAYRYAAEGRK